MRRAIDQKENSFELIEAKAKASHYRARRIRKYPNRSLVVRPAEKTRWSRITPAFITEESDNCKDQSIIIEHKIIWRSQSLSEFMEELDWRYNAKVRKEDGAVIARKLGIPSPSVCPAVASKWAVAITSDPSIETSTLYYNIC